MEIELPLKEFVEKIGKEIGSLKASANINGGCNINDHARFMIHFGKIEFSNNLI